jgi:hypothetical protein
MEQHLRTLTVDDTFLSPALMLLRDYSRKTRPVEELTDEQFLRNGVEKVLGQSVSGRDFIQTRQDCGVRLARSTWFDALHSNRRLGMIEEVAEHSYEVFARMLKERDWLALFPELADRAVWAVDGHQIEHASHAQRGSKGEHVPVGMLYGLCLHHGLMRPLVRNQGDGKYGHEMKAFKGRWLKWLRLDAKPGVPIVVADPAYIDIGYWYELYRKRHAVVILREKANMKPMSIGHIDFDRDDPVNRGVLADERTGYSCGGYIRRIQYKDPATGNDYVFITTDPVLRPGVIALLYLMRWKIEKAYDVFKNKLEETKAWAAGETANMIQAHLIALVHNLLTLLMANLEKIGIDDDKTARKRAERLNDTPEKNRVPSVQMTRFCAQLSCQFIRLLRTCLTRKTPWIDALPLFESRLKCYL